MAPVGTGGSSIHIHCMASVQNLMLLQQTFWQTFDAVLPEPYHQAIAVTVVSKVVIKGPNDVEVINHHGADESMPTDEQQYVKRTMF